MIESLELVLHCLELFRVAYEATVYALSVAYAPAANLLDISLGLTLRSGQIGNFRLELAVSPAQVSAMLGGRLQSQPLRQRL
jgi:hypothetical protein